MDPLWRVCDSFSGRYRHNRGENMQKLRTVIIGIAVAVLLSYIISSIYARYKYPVSLSEGQPSGKSVCVYEDGQ